MDTFRTRNQGRWDEIESKLRTCARISNEHREQHDKLMTVYSAFRRLYKSANLVRGNTSRLLDSMPDIMDDAKLRAIREETNMIMKDFQEKMDTVHDELGGSDESANTEDSNGQNPSYDFNQITREQVMKNHTQNAQAGGGGGVHRIVSPGADSTPAGPFW